MKKFSLLCAAVVCCFCCFLITACAPSGILGDPPAGPENPPAGPEDPLKGIPELPEGWSVVNGDDWVDVVSRSEKEAGEDASLGDVMSSSPGVPIPGGESEGSVTDPVPDGQDAWKEPPPGQLTSGAWSDIKNYEFYLALFNAQDEAETAQQAEKDEGFKQFIGYFGFETRYMFTVSVNCADVPVRDAAVELYDSDQQLLFAAKTDARGDAYLFPSKNLTDQTVTVTAKSGDTVSSATFVYAQNDYRVTLQDSAAAGNVLDLMFVIDTTGSMGDEMRYLNAEMKSVIAAVAAENPNLTINLALLFYRDIGDIYVTRYCDFTADIDKQRDIIGKQNANGGGDFPEAADRALLEAVSKNWTKGSATRILFHVCDAPPHDDPSSQSVFLGAVTTAAQKGIRILPIASSGIDKETEYLLRQEALMTGGTYVFLTNDSGIGGDHIRPTLGEYTVEFLNAAIVRLVNEYVTGVATDPVLYNK